MAEEKVIKQWEQWSILTFGNLRSDATARKTLIDMGDGSVSAVVRIAWPWPPLEGKHKSRRFDGPDATQKAEQWADETAYKMLEEGA